MANTFTIATSNLGTKQLPLPGVATMSSGGVIPEAVTPVTAESFFPLAPSGPGRATYGNTV
jgi:hypothetical protein